MPLVEWESTGDPRYGTGLEALGFSASWPEVAHWWNAHSQDIPPLMTAASLREAGVTP